MQDKAFEWDDTKGAANWHDHGVSFQDGIKAFRDRFAVERFDDREDYGEERINPLSLIGENAFSKWTVGQSDAHPPRPMIRRSRDEAARLKVPSWAFRPASRQTR
jgi:uncharacterized DUF497 family protein